MDEDKPDDTTGAWRWFSLVVLLVLTICLASLATVVLYYETNQDNSSQNKLTKTQYWYDKQSRVPIVPTIFHDLTSVEIKNLMHYIYRQPSLNITPPDQATIDSSYLYVAELKVPSKKISLNFLDADGEKPPREARIVLFRGDQRPAVVEEYIVGPLENISYHRLFVSRNHQKPAPFLYRPVSNLELKEVQKLLKHIDKVLKNVLLESYEASFFDCGNRCLLSSYYTPASPAVTGQDVRKIWYWTHHAVEHSVLHPVDLFFLFNLDGCNSSTYHVEKIMYAGQLFDSVEDLLEDFTSDRLQKVSMNFPGRSEIYSSELRGNLFPNINSRSPKHIEPDSKRYFLADNHIDYMGWSFDFRMSTISGPQIYDIRYNGERIIYELSLQEIAVFHSGYQPWIRFADIVLSGLLLGAHAKFLVPGVDCPSHASFVSSTHVLEDSLEPSTYQSSLCVFEQSTGIPLRRHHSYSKQTGRFYTGLEDIVLILRTIVAIFHYDFIIDFIFHQNGVVEVKVTTSGYILPTIFSPEETRYGFQIAENIISNLFQYNMHFKVDIDIHGENNRFESLDIEPKTLDNTEWSTEKKSVYEQIYFRRQLKMTELETVLSRNSSSPKYLIFHNKQYKTNYKDLRGYQIVPDKNSMLMTSEGLGNKPSVSWIRHQMAVSTYKDDEIQSSSIYAMWDGKEPIVNFQSFIDDNDNIVDKDLVAWVTIGQYHIPHLEDFPLITTSGKHRTFTISPFNYFNEDPSMASRDEFRMSVKDHRKSGERLQFEDHGLPKLFFCDTEYKTDMLDIFGNTSDIFEP